MKNKLILHKYTYYIVQNKIFSKVFIEYSYKYNK